MKLSVDATLLTRSAWLFDLDGTLVDSSTGVIRAFHAAQAAFEEPLADSNAIRQAIGYPLEETVARLSRISFDRFLPEFRREALSTMHLDSRLLPFARELLQALAERGRGIALVTSKRRDNALLILSHLGIAGLFGSVVGADTAARAKPDPSPVRRALADLAVSPEDAVMVGDTCADIEAAHAAAVPVIAVLSGFEPGEALQEAEAQVEDLGVILRRVLNYDGHEGLPDIPTEGPQNTQDLNVYTRPACPLCEELTERFRAMGIRFVERDITADPAWYDRFRERVPVVVDGTGTEHDPPHAPGLLALWRGLYG